MWFQTIINHLTDKKLYLYNAREKNTHYTNSNKRLVVVSSVHLGSERMHLA